jgi:putative ABC transport system permease protein
MLWESNPRRKVEQQMVTPPNLADWRDQSDSFVTRAYWSGNGDFNFVTADGVEKVSCAYATSGLFSALLVQPHLGRVFLPEEDQPQGNRVAAIGYEFWQRQYAGDPNVIGQSLTIDTFGRRDYTIVGVMPQGFSFPDRTEIWLPVGWDGLPRNRRGGHWLSVIARLRDGVSLPQVQAEMNTIQARIEEQHAEDLIGSQVVVVPLLEQTIGRNMGLALLILWGVVACVLLIACANVANLLLARAADRRKEIAIRIALGGGRWRLIRQLLTESLLLAFAGSVVGVLLANWSLSLLIAFNADNIPRLSETRLDGWSLAFTLLVTGLTGLLFGLAPAWQATKPDVHDLLKDSGRGMTAGWHRSRLRRFLVAAEVALSLVLLIGAGLMIRSFAQLTQVDRGFQTDRLLTARLDFSVSGFTTWARPTGSRPQVTVRELVERLQNHMGIQSVAAISDKASFNITIENRQSGVEEDYPRSSYQAITPDYFRTMGIPLREGRSFTESDAFETPRVVILSESLAKQCFPNESPLGKRIYSGRLNPGQAARIDPNTPHSPWTEIVGVVADVKSQSLDPQVESNIYVPYWQWPMQTPTLVVRTTGDSTNIATALYSEVKAVNKNLPVPKVQTMNDRLSDVVAQPRFQTLLLTLFGLVALALVSAGIYGVISYSVAQRTQEIGVRLALGAQGKDVLSMIVKQGMTLALIGLLIGLLASLALTQLMRSLLFSVSPTDPVTFIVIPLLLALIALLSCYIPARRATKVDPSVALRHE